jgi:hypothetical protein
MDDVMRSATVEQNSESNTRLASHAETCTRRRIN